MKIILYAYGCRPFSGSESGVGWHWLKELAKYNKVFLLFYEGQGQYNAVRDEIKRLNYDKNVKLFPISVPGFLQRRFLRLRHEVWHIKAFFIVKRLVKKEKIDIIHQVTISAWWFHGYCFLLNVPLILGPISGGQYAYNSTLPFLRKKDILHEMLRKYLVRILFNLSITTRLTFKKSSLIFSANEESTKLFRKITKLYKIISFTEIGIDNVKHINKNKIKTDKIKLLWCGLLIPRKNFGLLLRVLSLLKDHDNWILDVIGCGSMYNYWQNKTKRYGLEKKIIFHGSVPYKNTFEFYSDADIFVFPSIREASGTVILEAMSYGLPVIALNINGAKTIIDEKSGIKIDIKETKQIIHDFFEAIKLLIENKELRISMGINAQKRVLEKYKWENRGKEMQQYYKKVLNR